MSPDEKSQLGYPICPITATVLLSHVAEIPAQAAVDIAAEVIRRRYDLPEGAHVDAEGWLGVRDRHEGWTRIRRATDDEREALRVTQAVRFGRGKAG